MLGGGKDLIRKLPETQCGSSVLKRPAAGGLLVVEGKKILVGARKGDVSPGIEKIDSGTGRLLPRSAGKEKGKGPGKGSGKAYMLRGAGNSDGGLFFVTAGKKRNFYGGVKKKKGPPPQKEEERRAGPEGG